MSATPSNPFVLPGFGQSGDAATNPLMASLEMMRQAFAGLAGPAGMTGGLSLNPPMNPEELERKIAELKSVENWLKLNLSMLSSTIQGMEVQLATIATPPSWMSGWPTTPSPSEPSAKTPQAESKGPAASDSGVAAPPAAAKAWWDMLQHQFSQVAAATAASMASTPAPTAGKAPAKRARTAKKASSKVNTKKAS
jgi:hypothetical protein